MNLLGFSITRSRKSASPVTSPPSSRGGWWPIVREGFTGAWQRNIEVRPENVLSFYAVYSCVTLIASDIGKLRIKLMQRDKAEPDIWHETESPAFSPVLRKPNRYQTRIKFFEQWLTSKLIHGNTYVLKERDNRGVVRALYVLDPTRVQVLIASDGGVYYSLQTDDLAGVSAAKTVVPAGEIIHDVMVPLYHPLCGVSPISACGIPAITGLQIQNSSSNFFRNGATPSGILTAPNRIHEEERIEIHKTWDSNYTGDNAGKVAVLGNGLTYEPMSMNAVDSELIDQLKMSAENVCSVYHVPAYMVGVGPAPSYNNVEALNLQYYTQCLQNPIESIEVLLDEGLELPSQYGTEFELDDLMRMDTPTRIKASSEAIGGGGMSPNEARRRFLNLGKVPGGDTPYLQQQNFSLAALEKRDAKDDPFENKTPNAPAPAQLAAPAPVNRQIDQAELRLLTMAALEQKGANR